ncbi:MAG: 4Fe-4S ferredoxin, partial [Microcystis sp.]
MLDKNSSPFQSLVAGHWFKLICGASYQDLPTIRNLALTYTIAGADCIDVAADRAVIVAAREGIETA